MNICLFDSVTYLLLKILVFVNEFDILMNVNVFFSQITTVTDRLEANRGMVIKFCNICVFFLLQFFVEMALSLFNNNGQLEHSCIVMEMCWSKDEAILYITVVYLLVIK